MRIALVVGMVASGSVRAETARQAARPARSGAAGYESACAACHSSDGRGQPATTVGFDTPLPDFTDCNYATREQAADWFAVVHDGGPVRAFSRRMPAFGEALSSSEIDSIVEYVRAFCSERSWPPGELNLPRPLVSEKAYPEDEAVVTVSIDGRDGSTVNQLLYERRVGARHQFEIAIPIVAQRSTEQLWQGGLGDVAVAVKRVLAHSLARGAIMSAGAEVVLPTGEETRGLGSGTTVIEPFVAFGQVLRGSAFLQAQVGSELPVSRERAEAEAFWRAAVGRTFEQGRFGRQWSPMVELLGARELVSGEGAQWDVVPQMQISLSKRQHILISGGFRVPLTDRRERSPRIIAYVLWDWFDGGIGDGWR